MSELELNEEQKKILDVANEFEGKVLDDSMSANQEILKPYDPFASMMADYSPQVKMPIFEDEAKALNGKFLVSIYDTSVKEGISKSGNQYLIVEFKTNVVCDKAGNTEFNKRKLFFTWFLGDKVQQFGNPDGKTDTQRFLDDVSTIHTEPVVFKDVASLKEFVKSLKERKFWADTKQKNKRIIDPITQEVKYEKEFNDKGYPVQKSSVFCAEFAIPVTIQQ